METFQLLCLACLSGLAFSLTQSDMDTFGTNVFTETNTELQGSVYVSSDEDNWIITGNGIPDHETGTYPAKGNPNSIIERTYEFTVQKEPTVASDPTCLPPGPIGVATNGIVFFNPWTSQGKNAVTGETFDLCDGHPNGQGIYHYHKMPSSCLFTYEEGTPSPLIGVAFDGFGIYGPVDENGITLLSSDLDSCHGRYNDDGVYQYHATTDFPYILGCFKGTPLNIRNKLLIGDKCYFATDADSAGEVA